jgi:predicted nucleotidyltransferase
MRRDQALAALRRHAADLRSRGVCGLFLFGSTARDEAAASSDVDLFFDFDAEGFSLVELVALQQRVSEILQAPADLMSRGSIHPQLRASIEGSAVQVF